MNPANYSTDLMKAICILVTDDEYAIVDYFFTVISIVINFLTCPLVIILNALFITAMRKNRRLQTMHNILLACMAGTDLAVGLGCQPVFIAQDIFQAAGGSLSFYCKFFVIQRKTTTCLCLLSLLHLALISWNVFCDEMFTAIRQHRDQILFNCSSCMLLADNDFLLGHLVDFLLGHLQCL